MAKRIRRAIEEDPELDNIRFCNTCFWYHEEERTCHFNPPTMLVVDGEVGPYWADIETVFEFCSHHTTEKNVRWGNEPTRGVK